MAKGTLHKFFSNPKTPSNSKAPNKSATNSQQKPNSTSKRSREGLQRSDADLLDQLTNPPPVSQPDTPALGPRRKKLRTLLGDGEDKQTASYRCSTAAMLQHLHANMASCRRPIIMPLMFQGGPEPLCLARSQQCPRCRWEAAV